MPYITIPRNTRVFLPKADSTGTLIFIYKYIRKGVKVKYGKLCTKVCDHEEQLVIPLIVENDMVFVIASELGSPNAKC